MKMKKLCFYCSLLFVIFLFGSCVSFKPEPLPDPTPLTLELIKNKKIGEKILYESQYFTSDKEISFERDIDIIDTTKVDEGKVFFINGRYVEKIIIPSNTPGVLIPGGIKYSEGKINHLKITFDLDQRNYLIYSPDKFGYFVFTPTIEGNILYGLDNLNNQIPYQIKSGIYSQIYLFSFSINERKSKTKILPGQMIKSGFSKKRKLYFD